MFGAKKGPHADLEKRLGHRFRNTDLLERALRHASTRGDGKAIGDNERLEFLGDRVLGLAIAELVTESFPNMSEGDLALRFTRLVRRETCAEVARDIGLGDHLVFSGSERHSGGRANTTILGDACEAMLGAIFLDAGYIKSRNVVRRLWGARISQVFEIRTDAKTAAQEWAQGRGMPLPQYRTLSRSGPDHAPRFEIELTIRGLAPAVGVGSSKRSAEQAAAEALLEREGVWSTSA